MKKTSIVLASTLMLAGLAGCGPTTPQSIVFTKDQLGSFMGEFFAPYSQLTIGTNGATLISDGEKVKLNNVKIEGEGFETVVTYSSSHGELTVGWTEDDVKKVLVTVGEYSMVFQPSLESVQGWYTGDGYSGSGYVTYITTNDFNDDWGLFEGAGGMDGSIYQDNFAVGSGFTLVDSEVKLCYEFYFTDDLSEPFETYFVVRDEETGKIDLMYIDWPEYFSFESAVTPFDYSFFDPDVQDLYEGLSFWGTDEWEKTVYVGWDEDPSTYVEGFDDHGQFITVKGMKIRGTRYGITVEENGSTKEMPLNKAGLYSWMEDIEFVNGSEKIKYYYDWDEYAPCLDVNGEKCDSFEYVVKDHQLMMKGTLNDDVYFMDYYDEGVAYVEKNGESNLYLNISAFASIYARDYFDQQGNVLKVAQDLTVTYLEQTIPASLSYDEEYGVILVMSTGASIVVLSEENGLYVMMQGEAGQLLIDYDLVHNFFDIQFASQNYLLKITPSKVIFNDTDYAFGAYTMIQVGYTYYPGMVVTKHTSTYVVVFFSTYVVLYNASSDGDLTLVSSFVPLELLNKAVGDYKYSGKNGVETVKFSSDHILTVDTSTSDTTFEPVVYDYMPSIDEYGNLALSFEYTTSSGTTSVPVLFDLEGHASIFDIHYTEMTFFNNQGAYTSGSTICSLVDNVLKMNGHELNIISFSNNVIVAELDVGGTPVEITFTFTPGTSVTISGIGSPTTYAKSEITLLSFVGEYLNVSESGYDIIIGNDGSIGWRMNGSTFPAIPLTVDINYVLIDGSVAIQFEYAGYLYTLVMVDGVPTCTAESTMPPPPPLPPM